MCNITEPSEAIKKEAREMRIRLMEEDKGFWTIDPELVILHMLCNGTEDRAAIKAEVLKCLVSIR